MRRKLICILLLLTVTVLPSCATVEVEKTLPTGEKLTAKYTRFWNQEIDGFSLTTPDGWTVSFDGQKGMAPTFNITVPGGKIDLGGDK